MPPFYSKKRTHIDKILQDASCATSRGGQLVVDPLAKGLRAFVVRCQAIRVT